MSVEQTIARQSRMARILARARQRQLELASEGDYIASARYALLAQRLRGEHRDTCCATRSEPSAA